MIEYIVADTKYALSYQDLKVHYAKFCAMNDAEFLQSLPSAAHLACIICYLKEIPCETCLSDKGIVHELIHLMAIPNDTSSTISEIRTLFKSSLELA